MKFEQLQTPCYIIDKPQYEKNLFDFTNAFQKRWGENIILGYSIKTNHLPRLIEIAKTHGWWAETVSPDEYQYAKTLGFAETNIIYNGPQKGDLILEAVNRGSIVNLDNLDEVFRICEQKEMFRQKKLRIGIRINLDLEKSCPGETTSGTMPSRFGICIENGDLKKALDKLEEAGLSISGIHLHSSSKTRSLNIYRAIVDETSKIIKNFKLLDLDYIDIGGGFWGGDYFPGKPTYDEYAETICTGLKNVVDASKVTLVLEPGAAVLATSMEYLVSVLNIRNIRNETIVTVDGTSLHINPFMKIQKTPCTFINTDDKISHIPAICGSTCMELDRFYPMEFKGDLTLESKIIFHCAGAYMAAHNSPFINVNPNIYEKDENDYTCIRQRDLSQMMLY